MLKKIFEPLQYQFVKGVLDSEERKGNKRTIYDFYSEKNSVQYESTRRVLSREGVRKNRATLHLNSWGGMKSKRFRRKKKPSSPKGST